MISSFQERKKYLGLSFTVSSLWYNMLTIFLNPFTSFWTHSTHAHKFIFWTCPGTLTFQDFLPNQNTSFRLCCKLSCLFHTLIYFLLSLCLLKKHSNLMTTSPLYIKMLFINYEQIDTILNAADTVNHFVQSSNSDI